MSLHLNAQCNGVIGTAADGNTLIDLDNDGVWDYKAFDDGRFIGQRQWAGVYTFHGTVFIKPFNNGDVVDGTGAESFTRNAEIVGSSSSGYMIALLDFGGYGFIEFTFSTASGWSFGDMGFGDNMPSIVVGDCTTLPVELSNFKVKGFRNSILLNWTTQNEVNNKGFEILKSSDHINFASIGFINGNGNSSSVINYQFIDQKIEKGITYYYKLKQIDFNDEFKYSETKVAKIELDKFFEINNAFPNPVQKGNTQYLNIVANEKETLSIDILNISGKLINSNQYNLEKELNKIDLKTNTLNPGVYFLNMKSVGGNEITKIVIQD